MLSLAAIAPTSLVVNNAPLVMHRRAVASMCAPPPPVAEPVSLAEEDVPPPPPPLPKIKTMMVGDGTLAGDMNFDPLGFAKTSDSLAWMREAEIKHSRLAMLAALGWPVSEFLNLGGLANADGRAPSILNGGLENISVFYWAGVAALAVYWEGQGLDKQFGKKDNYLPGMLGFDPLGMDADWTRNAEVTNGRVAMLAITAFAFEEALTKAPIFPLNLLITPQVQEAYAQVKSAASSYVLSLDDLPESLQPPPAPVAEVAAAVSDAADAAAAVVDAVKDVAVDVAASAPPLDALGL